METKTIELPDKMSELIRVALGDLREAEKAPGVAIDMHVWHEPYGGVCSVCLAGAVMRRAFGDHEECEPEDFTDGVNAKLAALNHLRLGAVGNAYFELFDDASTADQLDAMNRRVVEYAKDRARFYTDMEQLAADLEAAGY